MVHGSLRFAGVAAVVCSLASGASAGTLYSVITNGANNGTFLASIDYAAGTMNVIGNMGLSGTTFQGNGDLAYDDATGTMYFARGGDNRIYTVNTSTGQASFYTNAPGAPGGGTNQPIGLAFNQAHTGPFSGLQYSIGAITYSLSNGGGVMGVTNSPVGPTFGADFVDDGVAVLGSYSGIEGLLANANGGFGAWSSPVPSPNLPPFGGLAYNEDNGSLFVARDYSIYEFGFSYLQSPTFQLFPGTVTSCSGAPPFPGSDGNRCDYRDTINWALAVDHTLTPGSNFPAFSGLEYVPTPPTAPVPEPETYAMMLAGLGLLGGMARRRRAINVANRLLY